MIDLGLTEILLTLVSGSIVGFLLALFGGGGSVLAAPLLLGLVGVSLPHVAIGTSAAAVATNAVAGLIGHWRKGRVKWPCATVFAIAGLLGSIGGSTLAKSTDGNLLLLAFAGAMAAIALSMLRKPASEGNPDVRIDWPLVLKLAPIGLLAGFAAGFFGIGGGFLIIPGLMLAAGMTISNAAASSLLSVTVFGAATAANYALSGLVDWRLYGLLVAGGIVGTLIGLKVAGHMTSNMLLLRRLFAGLVLLVAAYVAWQSLGAIGVL
jgi:hypothetical protein